jgi:hypothetical protein
MNLLIRSKRLVKRGLGGYVKEGKELMQVFPYQPIKELERLMNLKPYAPIRDRIRAVVLACQGQTAPQIGQILSRHFRWVQRRVYRYRDKGLAGLANRSLPGQPTPLAKERVKAFEDRIAAGQPGTQSHRAALAGFSGSRRIQ